MSKYDKPQWDPETDTWWQSRVQDGTEIFAYTQFHNFSKWVLEIDGPKYRWVTNGAYGSGAWKDTYPNLWGWMDDHALLPLNQNHVEGWW